MKYTIEDLRGKYVKTGTPEAEVFLDACTKVGAEYASKDTTGYKFVELNKIDTGELILCGLISEPSCKEASTPFTISPDWSIYTNTLPLCELTDEQAWQLFNAWRKGAALQIFDANNGAWEDYNGALCKYDVFRIKKKSERE